MMRDLIIFALICVLILLASAHKSQNEVRPDDVRFFAASNYAEYYDPSKTEVIYSGSNHWIVDFNNGASVVALTCEIVPEEKPKKIICED